MKRRIIITLGTFLLSIMHVNAQVGIETENIGESAILDFPGKQDKSEYATKTIQLPYLSSNDTAGTTPGTFVYNTQDGKVYYYDGKTSAWVAMSDGTNSNITNYSSDENQAETGVVISDKPNVGTPKGILELDSDSKALALPIVKNVSKMPAPPNGSICYDLTHKALAIFDGEQWTFWRQKFR